MHNCTNGLGYTQPCSPSPSKHPISHAFENIKQGLCEAMAHAKAKGANKPTAIKLHPPHPVDVPALRDHVGVTQDNNYPQKAT
jgi:hypothetical protein